MSDDLVAFLLARITEDEQVARAARGDSWEVGPTFGARDNRVYVRRERDLIDSVGTCVIAGQVPNVPEFRANAAHIARWDPARVLAECEAKRRIVELHTGSHQCQQIHTGLYPPDWPRDASYGSPGETWRHTMSEHYEDGPCPTLRLLALPYAGHKELKPHWVPDSPATSEDAG